MGVFAVAGVLAAALVKPAVGDCNLGNGIKHVVYIQLDNVHFTQRQP